MMVELLIMTHFIILHVYNLKTWDIRVEYVFLRRLKHSQALYDSIDTCIFGNSFSLGKAFLKRNKHILRDKSITYVRAITVTLSCITSTLGVPRWIAELSLHANAKLIKGLLYT